MRISSTLFFQTGLNSINAQQSDLMHLYQQIGSGQRMVTPSDDPLGAAQAINLSQSQTLNKRFADNRAVANTNLGIEENTLNSVTTLLQDLKTRLVEAGNGTLSDADRSTLSDVLKNTRQTLLGLANATDGNGQYLFSGSKGDIEPYQADASGRIRYHGDDKQRYIQADQTRQVASSDVGPDIFNRATPGTSVYLSRADSNNDGTGVMGSPSIMDPENQYVGYTYEVEFGSDGAYTVRVLDEKGNAVKDGADDVEFNGNYDPASEAPLNLPVGVQVKLTGMPQDGDTFVIEPAGGSDLNIFDTLDNIAAALANSIDGDAKSAAEFHNVLNSAMQRIDVNYNNVLTVRASVGARMNELDALNASGNQRDLGYRQQLSKLEDVDYYTVTAQLQLRTAALEAASLAFRKIQSTSLFNMAK